LDISIRKVNTSKMERRRQIEFDSVRAAIRTLELISGKGRRISTRRNLLYSFVGSEISVHRQAARRNQSLSGAPHIGATGILCASEGEHAGWHKDGAWDQAVPHVILHFFDVALGALGRGGRPIHRCTVADEEDRPARVKGVELVSPWIALCRHLGVGIVHFALLADSVLLP